MIIKVNAQIIFSSPIVIFDWKLFPSF